MKRTALVLVPVALACFLLGAATQRAKKFPYVNDALNKSCDKTEFEWRCATAKVDAAPVPLKTHFDLVGLLLLPQPKGLLVKAQIRPKADIPEKAITRRAVADAVEFYIRSEAEKRAGTKFADDFRDLEIEAYFGTDLLARRNVLGMTVSPKVP